MSADPDAEGGIPQLWFWVVLFAPIWQSSVQPGDGETHRTAARTYPKGGC